MSDAVERLQDELDAERDAETKKDLERSNTRRMRYRQVFASDVGRDVLTDILNDLGFFSAHVETPEERALANYARKLLGKLGIWRDPNRFLMVDTLMSLPWEDKVPGIATGDREKHDRAKRFGPREGGPGVT